MDNPAMANDLQREFDALADRRSFGLNFERHIPETVELPGRRVRKGDKVRVLPPRGEKRTEENDRLWRVVSMSTEETARVASLLSLDDKEAEGKADIDDLVVVAEFRDPIYPGLVSTGRVKRGGDKPFHTVINAENFHALQTLLFTHRGKVDCIYIDPPYNTGAKDWKYNNDYVESDDHYRHSKWLAMMERRLLLARDLLDLTGSVLMVAIDEREVHRVGLLLEQLFANATIQMVTSVISAKGAVRVGKFSRVEEHIFCVTFGDAGLTPWERNMLDAVSGDSGSVSSIEWLGLRRREPTSTRGARPNQFFPIFVDAETGHIQSIGDAIADEVDRDEVPVPDGMVALWPLKPDGTEMLWGLTPGPCRSNWQKGFVRVNRWDRETQTGTVQYLPGGTVDLIQDGTINITGKKRDGSVIGTIAIDEESPPPKRVWNLRSHNAETGGTKVISALMPGRRFPFPKSLYAVEDALRFFIADKPDAVVLDFFAGSGTTAHAVMRLNKQDQGNRQCVLVTNNEVSAEEQDDLRERGSRPGDPDWEALGICEYITKPRLRSAVSGTTPDGNQVEGTYKYTDEFPMADGFDENVEFLTLTYEAPLRVANHREFKRIAPLLWLRAGSEGRRIEDISKGWDVADVYGVIADLDQSEDFLKAVAASDHVTTAFLVTDEDRLFEAMVAELPDGVEPVRLYEAYLRNFEIEAGRSVR